MCIALKASISDILRLLPLHQWPLLTLEDGQIVWTDKSSDGLFGEF